MNTLRYSPSKERSFVLLVQFFKGYTELPEGRDFWCIRKFHFSPKNRGLGGNYINLSPKPYQVITLFQGIDKKQE